MRKYKNKLTNDFVELSKSGEVYKGHFYTIPKKFVENSNDWIEVVEKDYEILVQYHNVITMNQGPIMSILRILDKIMFSVGDKVRFNGVSTYCDFTIDNFFKKNDGILARNKDNIICEYISDIKHIKKPLFVTEDGVDIWSENEVVFYLNKQAYVFGETIAKVYSSEVNLGLIFKNKENAQSYIDENKPKYSEKEILDVLNDNISVCSEQKMPILKSILKTWKLKNNK